MISIDEKIEIAKHLDNSHSLFRKFWDLGDPTFTDKIPTAAVGFNDQGELIEYLFNEEFWNKLPTYDRAFVIAHEMLHILLEHGKRIVDKNANRDIANKAMDICVNGLLVDNFGFDRSKLVIEQVIGSPLCWYDTFFKDSKIVKKNREAEYYYNMLMKLEKSGKYQMPNASTVDSHLAGNEASKVLKNVISNVKESIEGDKKICDIITGFSENKDNKELQKIISDAKLAGFGSGQWLAVMERKVSFSKKWNNLIKRKDVVCPVYDIVDMETFLKKSKRLQYAMPDDICLPSESMMEEIVIDKDKIQVFMFLDISGSCLAFKDDFYEAYKTIDRRRFAVRIFSFDTSVEELDSKKAQVYGSGGTNFGIIEQCVQKIKKEEKLDKYPHVFVLTDGWGTKVNPQIPENWCWFMTKVHSTEYIPKKSRIFKIEDYVR